MKILKPDTTWAVHGGVVPNEQCAHLYYPLNIWACNHPERKVPYRDHAVCHEWACPIRVSVSNAKGIGGDDAKSIQAESVTVHRSERHENQREEK